MTGIERFLQIMDADIAIFDSPDAKELVDPKGPAESRFNDRVIRGGSFYNGARACRSAWISSESPRNLSGDFGFRIVMDE